MLGKEKDGREGGGMIGREGGRREEKKGRSYWHVE